MVQNLTYIFFKNFKTFRKEYRKVWLHSKECLLTTVYLQRFILLCAVSCPATLTSRNCLIQAPLPTRFLLDIAKEGSRRRWGAEGRDARLLLPCSRLLSGSTCWSTAPASVREPLSQDANSHWPARPCPPPSPSSTRTVTASCCWSSTSP